MAGTVVSWHDRGSISLALTSLNNIKLDARQDQMARIRTNRCAAYPGWPVSALGSVGSGAEKRPLPHTPGWSCRGGKESDHLFGSGNRGQLEGGAQDMVVQDTGRVGG